ncbi:hypothetical protein L596_015872 [Steinernema carpocapsae]|uniref:Uncharacterized protein n=1 Tax=Steinernema carpocapsae TaxID=34508 RepID=A0A4U5NG98_STECR|nr:hypothetical protein L596_015872 [Steinernema carpocapsae]
MFFIYVLPTNKKCHATTEKFEAGQKLPHSESSVNILFPRVRRGFPCVCGPCPNRERRLQDNNTSPNPLISGPTECN